MAIAAVASANKSRIGFAGPRGRPPYPVVARMRGGGEPPGRRAPQSGLTWNGIEGRIVRYTFPIMEEGRCRAAAAVRRAPSRLFVRLAQRSALSRGKPDTEVTVWDRE